MYRVIPVVDVITKSGVRDAIEQPDITNRVPITLTQTDWNSISVILQAQTKHEDRRGNDEMADEICLLIDRVTIQLSLWNALRAGSTAHRT